MGGIQTAWPCAGRGMGGVLAVFGRLNHFVVFGCESTKHKQRSDLLPYPFRRVALSTLTLQPQKTSLVMRFRPHSSVVAERLAALVPAVDRNVI